MDYRDIVLIFQWGYMRLLSIRGDVGQVGPRGETMQKTWDTVYVPADDNHCSA